MSNAINPAANNNTSPTDNTPSATKASPLNGTFVATGGAVVVTVNPSDSGYKNKIYWSTDNFQTAHYIAMDNFVGNYTIGIFDEGTVIEFGINNGAGAFYRTGVVAADGIVHAQITKNSASTDIGFEDVYGGGDFDFNDALISVQNKPTTPAPAASSGGGGGGAFSLNLDKKDDGNAVAWPWHLNVQDGHVINGNNAIFDISTVIKKINNLFLINPKGSSTVKKNTEYTQTKEKNQVTPEDTQEFNKTINFNNEATLNLAVKKVLEPELIQGSLIEPKAEMAAVNPDLNGSTANLSNIPLTDLNQIITNNSSKDTTSVAQDNADNDATASTTDLKLLHAIYSSIG